MTWFAVTNLIGSFLFVRKFARLPVDISIGAGIAMTVASVAACAISLVACVGVRLLFESSESVSWIIPALLVSALTGALSGIGVLAAFRQKIARSAFCWLIVVNLICLGLTVYRTWTFICAHPAVA